MKHLIDKIAVIAEIDRIQNTTMDNNKNFTSSYDEGKFDALTLLENYIDTLEVKEVDLEKEYEEFVVDDPIFGNFITNDTMGMKLAKHFFELGLKAQKGE